MPIDETALLRQSYGLIQDRFSGLVLDSYKVVSDVVNHRNFWRPKAVRTMLLAESHVYTADDENAYNISYPPELHSYDIPRNFVRLVYCLGYGEQSLAPHIEKNSGTWQYWKIFAACASDTPDIDFGLVLKGENEPDQKRILNKFSIFQKLTRKGVWLVDCSSVSLYGHKKKRSEKQKRDMLRICWETYIRHLLDEARPDYVIVIGMRVGKIVGPGLEKMGIRHKTLTQPQAWLSSREQAEVLQAYQRICNLNLD
jgi:hypothetical protein